MKELKKKESGISLNCMLAEYREAVQDEIRKIERSGQTSTLLRRGRIVISGGSDFWYQFQIDYLPSIPSDTPCNLIVGKNQYDVTVVSFDENEIILSSPVELPDTIGEARLESGATVLMERLIKRIEVNAEEDNPAGERMLSQLIGGNKKEFTIIEPDLFVDRPKEMNEGQYAALVSSLKNDITYIWGPPGTGKTTVIGHITRELYKLKRNVLVVSHTNIAVDGAIEKVTNLRRRDGSCPILRIGISQKKLPEEFSIESHVQILGKEFDSKQKELKKQRGEKNKRVSEISAVLLRIDWVNEQKVDEIISAMQTLMLLEKNRDVAKEEYVQAAELVKRLEIENPEIKEFPEYQKKQMTYSKQADSLRGKIVTFEAKIDQATTSIQNAENELAKHTIYLDLKKKLSNMLSETFIEDKLIESVGIIKNLEDEKTTLGTRKRQLEGTIGQKGSFISLFAKKSIAQAEAELPSIENKIAQVDSEILEQKLVMENYMSQLHSVRSLKKQISDIAPNNTKKHWEDILSVSNNDLIMAQQGKEACEEKLTKKSENLKAIELLITKLEPLNEEMIHLTTESDSKKKIYSALRTKTRSFLSRLEETVEEEIKKLSKYNGGESLSDKIEFLQENLALAKKEIIIENAEALRTEREKLRSELNKINKKLREITEKINQLEKEVILKANIVGATLAKTYLSDTLQECRFDTVILDEASMASIPALWCASYLAQRNIIIVGDFLQLPPIVMAETSLAKKWLGSDIFTISGMKERAKNKKTKPDNFIMLNEQFRMEKDIADVANLYYGDYGGLSSDDYTEARDKARKEFLSWYQKKAEGEKCIELIDTNSLHAWVTTIPQGKTHSRLNCFSAALDVEMAFQMLDKDIQAMEISQSPLKTPKVLIVAPYKPHVERIKQLVKFEYKERNLPDDANLIKAGTIHSFQGNEADIVIFDLVLDEPHWRANLFIPDDEINANLKKLFNVAITRARFKLFVVGNVKYLRTRAKNNALSELLDYLVDTKKYKVIDAKNSFPDLAYAKDRLTLGNFGVNEKHIICRDDLFFDYFLKDVRTFKTRIIIYSPFMTANRITKLLPVFADSIAKGKSITVVTKALSDRGKTELAQYKKIETELISIGISIIHKNKMHEKLVFVDNDTVWMGSLNVLSFTGETGEVMHRHQDKEIAQEYQKIFNIPQIGITLQQNDELICPICGAEMTLNEGDEGLYWKCLNGDYSRNLDQQYPHDGILRCHCGGEYFFFMKNEPRWKCTNNEAHFIKMRKGDLKLPKMAEKIPTEETRRKVDQYFMQMMKETKAKKIKQAKEETSQKEKTKTAKIEDAKQNRGQLSLIDYLED